MPVLADLDMAREVILPALQRHPTEALKLVGLLQSGRESLRDVFVDDFSEPSAVLLRDGKFFSFYASDPKMARHLLGELAWKWTRGVAFAGVHERLVGLIEEQAPLRWKTPCWQYHLPTDVPMGKLKALRGGGERLRPLQAEDAELILTHWPYGEVEDADDRAYVLERLGSGPSGGWVEGGRLVSWALTNADLSLGFMHTLEGWRRQGIGLKVMAALTLQVCQEGWTPYGYVVSENAKPVRLLQELGYVRSEHRYVWLETEPR